MSTVTISITTKKQTVPSTPAPSSMMRYQLMQNGAQVDFQVTYLPALSATFTGVADGNYTVVVQRLTAQSQPIGASMSADFTVTSTSEIDVPDAVSVAVS